MKVGVGVEGLEGCTVGAYKISARRDWKDGGDPVVLEGGVGGGEIAADLVGLDDRDAAQGAGKELVALGGEGVYVVVDQALERVEALWAGGG